MLFQVPVHNRFGLSVFMLAVALVLSACNPLLGEDDKTNTENNGTPASEQPTDDSAGDAGTADETPADSAASSPAPEAGTGETPVGNETPAPGETGTQNPGTPNSNTPDPGTSSPENPNPGGVVNPLASALKLGALAGCDDFKLRLTETLYKQFTSGYGVISGGGMGGGDVVLGPSPTPAPNSDGVATESGSPDGVSGTNNQEAGVNEADLVKTDAAGNLYILHGHYLLIEQGFPPTAVSEAGRLDLQITGHRMFFNETAKQLVIFGQSAIIYLQDSLSLGGAIVPGMPKSEIIFVDVADITQPVITKRMILDSYFAKSRRIDNRIHMVNRFPTPVPEPLKAVDFQLLLQEYFSLRYTRPSTDTPDPKIAELEQKIHDTVAAAVQAADVDALLPHVVVDDGSTQTVQALLSCDQVTGPQVTTSNGMQVLSSMDTDGANLASVAVTGNAWQVYASAQHFYLAQTSGGWWWPASANRQPHTVIHKFAISNGAPGYVATGVVDGWSQNQFNFSEFNGFLRVATNSSYFNPEQLSTELSNNVFVLEDDGLGNLTVAGEVRGFGKNERMFSSRFVGNRGFVVTFRRIDPLFAFDLSDPKNPRLAGEVEIPGFSTYMHPLGSDHLLTIGRSGTATGVTNGVQLQIFDVSDLAAPRLAFSHTPVTGDAGYSWSEAMYNHLAFTYYGPKKLLIIPLTAYTGLQASAFNGFALFGVDTAAGFADLGRIDHGDLAFEAICSADGQNVPDAGSSCANGYYIYAANARRSVVMTDGPDTWAYTISGVGLKVNNVDALQSGAASRVIFPLK